MIYADNAATTRISDKVFDKMIPFLCEQYGNASSQYSLGVKSKYAIEMARKQVAQAIGAEPSEITFTSGGSEANSWIFQSVCELYRNEPTHIITSSIEHHSVLNSCHALEKKGISVSYLPIDSHGRVSVTDVEKSLRSDTKLVSIMLANNEIGTIQPISDIGRLLKSKGILFHTDAVQAVGHIPVDIITLCVDFLTASAHKFYGAKGTGILYKRSGITLPPLVCGGGQEHGLRAGTENVAGIVSAGYAIEESVKSIPNETKRLNKMIKATVDGIAEGVPSVKVNGDSDCRLPGIVNLGFDEISGESLMHLLDLRGICVSTSSACNSEKNEPSHVLRALGLSDQKARSAIRISYGKYNTADEVKSVVSSVCDAYNRIMAAKKVKPIL